MSITAAAQAKAAKHLEQLIRTSAYGVVTRGERVRRSLVDGASIEVASVRDEARERAIEREIQALRGRDGWGVPTGNESHPKTIQLRKLQAELAAGPMTEEFRLNRPDDEYFNVLTKTEYLFATQQ